jgi:prophage regulatory protein
VDPLFYDKRSVAQVVALSVSTLERLVREGEFPRPRKVSGNRVAWLRREIVEWAEARPVSDLLPPANTSGREHGNRRTG